MQLIYANWWFHVIFTGVSVERHECQVWQTWVPGGRAWQIFFHGGNAKKCQRQLFGPMSWIFMGFQRTLKLSVEPFHQLTNLQLGGIWMQVVPKSLVNSAKSRDSNWRPRSVRRFGMIKIKRWTTFCWITLALHTHIWFKLSVSVILQKKMEFEEHFHPDLTSAMIFFLRKLTKFFFLQFYQNTAVSLKYTSIIDWLHTVIVLSPLLLVHQHAWEGMLLLLFLLLFLLFPYLYFKEREKVKI